MGNDSEKDNKNDCISGEDYTFVRETIKKKPPVAVRGLLKVLKVLGLGAVFGLGICAALFVFNKDIRDHFMKIKDEETTDKDESPSITEKTQDSETISIDEMINSQLVDIVVVYYKQEESGEGQGGAVNETTEIYQGEELTADISDDKELQVSTEEQDEESQNAEEQTSEPDGEAVSEESNDTKPVEEYSGEEGESIAETKKIEEKKHYTGVIISSIADIYICISSDKISSAGDIYVHVKGSSEVKANVCGIDYVNNISVLKVDYTDVDKELRKSILTADIAALEELENGGKIVYMGNPYGKGRLYYSGSLAGVDSGHSNYDTFYRGIITDISNDNIQDGFLFDASGKLVAMVGMVPGEQTLGNNITGIYMDDIMYVARALMHGTPIRHLGLKGEAVTDDMRDLTGEQMPDGMYVTDVARDSSAYKSGIMAGDIITYANESKVENLKDIQNILEKSKENDTITFVFKRKVGTGYNEFTIKVPVETAAINVE